MMILPSCVSSGFRFVPLEKCLFKIPPENGSAKPKNDSAIIDLVAIAPIFLAAIVGVDLLFLRALRLLRILKVTRYFAPLGILWEVMKAESRAFLAALMVLAILTMIAASVTPAGDCTDATEVCM